jgi:hypothetical protein
MFRAFRWARYSLLGTAAADLAELSSPEEPLPEFSSFAGFELFELELLLSTELVPPAGLLDVVVFTAPKLKLPPKAGFSVEL